MGEKQLLPVQSPLPQKKDPGIAKRFSALRSRGPS